MVMDVEDKLENNGVNFISEGATDQCVESACHLIAWLVVSALLIYTELPTCCPPEVSECQCRGWQECRKSCACS